jgi:hypothetical protein
VAALVVLVLITLHLLLHRDEGGWQAKGNIRDTVTIEGHLVEWEWWHVGETVALIDAQGEPPRRIASQNLYRFGGAYAMALLREAAGGIYGAAVASTVLFWLAAAGALYGLARLAAGTSDAAVVAAAIVASAPGFIGYLANVDPHPAAYALVAVWLLVVERWRLLDPSGVQGEERAPAADVWAGPAFAGLLACVAGLALEVAYPLLLFAWTCYGLRALRRPRTAAGTAARLAVMTAAFALPYWGFRLLAERALFEQVVAFNEPHERLRGSLAQLQQAGLGGWLLGRWLDLPERWLAAFPPVVSALAVAGWLTAPRRWQVWAASFVLSFVAAVLLTKPATRTLYLAYPAIYVLAAGGAVRLASWAADRAAEAIGWRWRSRARRGILALLVLAVWVATNADLWGDYRIPVRWYGTQ